MFFSFSKNTNKGKGEVNLYNNNKENFNDDNNNKEDFNDNDNYNYIFFFTEKKKFK
jgi:hypothetical protein